MFHTTTTNVLFSNSFLLVRREVQHSARRGTKTTRRIAHHATQHLCVTIPSTNLNALDAHHTQTPRPRKPNRTLHSPVPHREHHHDVQAGEQENEVHQGVAVRHAPRLVMDNALPAIVADFHACGQKTRNNITTQCVCVRACVCACSAWTDVRGVAAVKISQTAVLLRSLEKHFRCSLRIEFLKQSQPGPLHDWFQ